MDRAGRAQGWWWLQLLLVDCKFNSETAAAQPSKALPKVLGSPRRSLRSSAQKLLHKLEYGKGVEILEQTGPKNEGVGASSI